MSSTAVAVAESVGIMAVVDMIDLQQQFTADITDRYNRIYRDVVSIGGTLVEAKKRLNYSQFVEMVEKKLPFGRSTAYSYIREWTIAAQNLVQPVGDLAEGYSVRQQLERLTPEQLEQGITAGRIHQGVSRSQVIDYRRELAAAHQHRPDALNTPAPSRPDGPGAATYGELVHLLIEWRKVRALPQSAVDHLIGCAEGQTGKYEIPHTDDGRTLTWKALFELCAVYRICVKFVPMDAA